MRKRFTKEERSTFQPGTRVEWQNGSHWHPATVIDVPKSDSDGWWHVGLTNHAKTRTVSPGEYITGTPGKVRNVKD